MEWTPWGSVSPWEHIGSIIIFLWMFNMFGRWKAKSPPAFEIGMRFAAIVFKVWVAVRSLGTEEVTIHRGLPPQGPAKGS